jgi:hypothetical protein
MTLVKVWLAAHFRIRIISEGIERADGINRLARIIGYRSRIHPAWPLRQILVGKQPFPMERLQKLSEFTGHEMSEVLKHEVPTARLANENSGPALKTYGFGAYVQ